MRNITITELKKMHVKDIKEQGSFNLVADGEIIAIVVIPISANKREQIQGICGQMNAAMGKE